MASIEQRTVTGTYEYPDGTPAVGDIRFIPSTTVYDTDGNVVVTPSPLTVTLDGSGEFEIDLYCTDDPEATPTGWTWIVSELFPPQREFEIQVPITSPAVVQITELLPATDVEPSYSTATLASVQALDARLQAVEAQSAATFAAVGVHPFLLLDS